jgi:hypothetical protein
VDAYTRYLRRWKPDNKDMDWLRWRKKRGWEGRFLKAKRMAQEDQGPRTLKRKKKEQPIFGDRDQEGGERSMFLEQLKDTHV